MNRFYQLLTLIFFLPVLGIAQQAPNSQKFTLEDCIQYALQNSVNAKNAILDQEIAENVIIERRSEGLPQISGNVTLQHNQKLPRFFSTKSTSFGFTGQDTSRYRDYLPGLKDNDVVASQNFFQLPSSGSASITVNQLIFNSSYFIGLTAMKTYRELSVKTTEQTKQQIIVNVTKAYYGVLINKDRIKLFDNNINRVDSLLKNTKALNVNGFAESIDVDRIKVTLNNLLSERDKFYNLQELGIQLLKFQMNYPQDQPFEILGDIASLQVDNEILGRYSSSWNYDDRIDYKILETNFKLQELDIKAKRARAIPTVNAFYNIGYQTQSPNISGLFKTNSPISDDGSVGPDKWYQYSNFGVTVHVPLFGGFQQHSSMQQAKLNQSKLENSFTLLKSSIDIEIKQSAISYINATKSLKSQEENRGLAEKIARITKIKYEQGVGSNIEVIEAESSLKETQINYYNALYDALIAKVDLDKAYGKLNPQPAVENK